MTGVPQALSRLTILARPDGVAKRPGWDDNLVYLTISSYFSGATSIWVEEA